MNYEQALAQDEWKLRLLAGDPIKCLDHGFVRYVDHMGSDEAIVSAARMSTGRGFVSWEPYERCEKCGVAVVNPVSDSVTGRCSEGGACIWKKFPRGDLGMLEFMYSHAHLTPFEFGVLHIEVQAPLFVFREWHRHRMQSYSEASARYTQMPNEHYVPAPERFAPKQTGNKQADSAPVGPNVFKVMPKAWTDSVEAEQDEIYESYELMLKYGVPKEVARINTPVSRYSKMRATTDLRNWLAFLTLRDAPSAQLEIQQYAKAVAEIVKALWPRTYALYEEHTKYAVTLSRSEARTLHAMGRGNFEPLPDSIWKKLEGAK